jgi:hypothetical protein
MLNTIKSGNFHCKKHVKSPWTVIIRLCKCHIFIIYTVYDMKKVLTISILKLALLNSNSLLFSDEQQGILGKSCIPSKLFTAKLSAIKLFVFKTK